MEGLFPEMHLSNRSREMYSISAVVVERQRKP